jgi:hypothetical protein
MIVNKRKNTFPFRESTRRASRSSPTTAKSFLSGLTEVCCWCGTKEMRTVNYGWKKRTIFYSKFPRGRLYIHWPVITEVVQELKSFHIIFTYTTIIIGYRNAQASTAKHVVHFQLCFVMYIYRQVQKGRTFLPS